MHQYELTDPVYDILAIFDQSWKKKEDRKKIEKYFKSSCLRELKIAHLVLTVKSFYSINECIVWP